MSDESLRTLPETWYCARILHDHTQGSTLCATRLVNGRCPERHKAYQDDCCAHGFQRCQHGQCELECDDRACESSIGHEYACMCYALPCDVARDLVRGPCHGECGCQGCSRAYSDFLDFE